MTIGELRRDFESSAAGAECLSWMRAWYPINRSITGPGLAAQLALISEVIPLEIREVTTGTRVLDWTVPREWTIRDAYVKNAAGERVIDYRQHNLHVLQYSVPVHARLLLSELKQHVYTLPDQPELIPYRTSYYKEQWGFCAADAVVQALPEGEYEVYIDSSLEDGRLIYGEAVLPGLLDEEVLISAHCCHPSLANDNLSGIAAAVWLARALQGVERRYTYRFVFAPGTIGAITWLAQHEAQVEKIAHGLILACVGDRGAFHYKRSRRGDAAIDRSVAQALAQSGAAAELLDFVPYGYDERQYCSPGFNLPVGLFTRSQPGSFPEYHTSGDNLSFVRADALGESLAALLAVVEILEGDGAYVNLSPKGEPQLGKRGLYSQMGGNTDTKAFEMALLWVLNFSDGDHTLLEIAARSGLDFGLIRRAADALLDVALLGPVEDGEIPAATAAATAPAATAETPRGRDRDRSPLEHAGDADFWDDFIEGDPDLSNESLADYFREEGSAG